MPWLNSIITVPVENLLEIASYPTIFLISPSGEILFQRSGMLHNGQLDEILAKYLQP